MESKEIYYLCQRIKVFHFCKNFNIAWKDGNPDAAKLLTLTGKTSNINMLIANYNWDLLFQDVEWLRLLGDVQNYNSLCGSVTQELRKIAELFPEETALHIFVEALPD